VGEGSAALSLYLSLLLSFLLSPLSSPLSPLPLLPLPLQPQDLDYTWVQAGSVPGSLAAKLNRDSLLSLLFSLALTLTLSLFLTPILRRNDPSTHTPGQDRTGDLQRVRLTS
jgi:hypothetical protein